MRAARDLVATQARSACVRPRVARGFADRLGIGVSLTCAVHCAAVGALSLVPSLLGGASEALEAFEMPLLLAALAIGLLALVPAYRREHHRPQPLALFGLGAASLLGSRFVAETVELGATVTGIACVAGAHLWNLHACGRCHATECEDGRRDHVRNV